MSCDYYHYDSSSFNPYLIYPNAKGKPVFEKSLSYWCDMIKNDSINQVLNPADRLYYDQRLGCWLSSTEQSFDIYDGVIPVQICNNRLIIGLLMGFAKKKRKNKLHEEMLVAHACSEFKRIKYDYQIVTLEEKMIKLLKLIKKHCFRK